MTEPTGEFLSEEEAQAAAQFNAEVPSPAEAEASADKPIGAFRGWLEKNHQALALGATITGGLSLMTAIGGSVGGMTEVGSIAAGIGGIAGPLAGMLINKVGRDVRSSHESA